MTTAPNAPRIDCELDGHVLHIRLARAAKKNAFDLQMLDELAEAYARLESTDAARVGVVYPAGADFTAGLDLGEVGPAVRGGRSLFEGSVDPLGIRTAPTRKPVVMATRGWCLTIGIELLLSADIRVAATDSRFGQIEINRGIFPFGGATVRWPLQSGWGNAMRWLLTGDTFDAEEALRIGLVQQLTSPDAVIEAAIAIARTIATRAPLGVQATLATARTSVNRGPQAAGQGLLAEAMRLMESDDAAEGLKSFLERREAEFHGR